MISLGKLALGGEAPRVAVGFSDDVSDEAIARIAEEGVDVAEIRIDLFKDYSAEYILDNIKRFQRLPTIATIRLKAEGGNWTRSEDERRGLFKALLPHVDAIDIELGATETISALLPDLAQTGKKLVVSYHNFRFTPSKAELDEIILQANNLGADIVKIATLTKNLEDVQRLATVLVSNERRNMIAIGMGAPGLVSRVLFPALGSVLTFASYGELRTAPGQLPFAMMFDMMRKFYPDYNQNKIIDLSLLEFA